MSRLRLSAAAEADIADILEWSQARFGEAAKARYGRLLAAALRALAEDPAIAGSLARPELGAGLRSLHLRAFRRRGGERVGRPRHLVIYAAPEPGLVEIVRVLHEAMELRRRLPEDGADG